MPEKMGLRIPEMLDMAVFGKLKAMFIMGEDPALTDADANHVRKALDSLEFLVAQNLFMTETAGYADVFLPAACYAEKDGTFTNTERRVQRVRKAVEPPGQCRADWEIIADLSCRLGHEMHYDSAEEIFDEMRTLVPSYAGITYERIDKTGIQWPCPDTDHPGTRFLHANGFTRGKGLLQGIEYEAPAELCTDEYPILLSTGVDNPFGLFGYIAILDAGLILVAVNRRWLFLVTLAAAGTIFMQVGWAGEFFSRKTTLRRCRTSPSSKRVRIASTTPFASKKSSAGQT